MTSSEIFEEVADAASMRMGLALVSFEEMFIGAGDDRFLDRVRTCGSDTLCIASCLQATGAHLGLVIVLDPASRPPLVSLDLIDAEKGTIIASAIEEARAEQGAPYGIRERAAGMLEAAGYVRAGRVRVDVDPPDARIILGGGIDPDPGTANIFTVRPGRYRVTARLGDKASDSQEAVVAAGSVAVVKIVLEDSPTLFDSPWFWVGAAAAVVGGTTAAIFLGTRGPRRCFCTTIESVGCEPCLD